MKRKFSFFNNSFSKTIVFENDSSLSTVNDKPFLTTVKNDPLLTTVNDDTLLTIFNYLLQRKYIRKILSQENSGYLRQHS